MLARIWVLSVLMVAFFAFQSYPAKTVVEEFASANNSIQPSGSDTIVWSSGRYITKLRDGTERRARGFEVVGNSVGGILRLHMVNDARNGQDVWLSYPIPASTGLNQRFGLIFDAIDSALTTIPIADVIIWY